MPTIALRGYWTYQDLMRIFDRSYMTIYVWKTKRGLPHLQFGPKRVLFPKQRVLEWATKNGIVYRLGRSSENVKPSPTPQLSGVLKSNVLPSSA